MGAGDDLDGCEHAREECIGVEDVTAADDADLEPTCHFYLPIRCRWSCRTRRHSLCQAAEIRRRGLGATAEKEAYTLYDLYASYKANEHATAFVNVENLTDVAYSPAVSGDSTVQSGRGRTIVGGVTLQF
ncbi:MAG: TonB-dependent receptor [Rhizobiales bacterium]|nr:TonB-dependent receptor [Hyphomicrobiales bacterium]